MSSYDDFLANIKLVVNESDEAMDSLVPNAVRHAVRTLERKYQLAYMRGVEYHRLDQLSGAAVELDSYTTLADGELIIQGEASLSPGVIGILLNTAPPLSWLQVGTWIRFGTDLVIQIPFGLTDIASLQGASGRILSVSPQPHTVIYTVWVGSEVTNAFQGSQYGYAILFAGATITRLSRDPNVQAVAADPGLVQLGRRLKRIDVVDVCDPADRTKVLRKDIPQFDPARISPEADTTSADARGGLPEGYLLLGAAEVQDPVIFGTNTIADPESKIALVRPKPDQAYWLRFLLWRYSDWPQPEHWLLNEGEDVLFWASMVELQPWLRDQQMAQSSAAMLASKLADLGISNVYLRESGDTGRMEYDAYRDRRA